MSHSDRYSDRAGEQTTNPLVNASFVPPHGADDRRLPPDHGASPGGPGSTSGADDRGIPLAFLESNGERLGRRRLAEARKELSDRDLAILHALRDLHFMTTRQLERLAFPVGPMTPLAAARSCRRVMARLHALHLVDRLDRRIGGVRAGAASYVYRLSDRGSRLLKTSTRRRSREPGRAHLDHVLAVTEVIVRLHEEARSGLIDVLEIETEPDCWRTFVSSQGGSQLLKPDLRVAIGNNDRELHWFVEQDNGSEHRPVLARKLETYRQAWRDGRISQELSVFPRVLWIVPDQVRETVLSGIIAAATGLPSGMCTVVTSDRALAVLCGHGEPA